MKPAEKAPEVARPAEPAPLIVDELAGGIIPNRRDADGDGVKRACGRCEFFQAPTSDRKMVERVGSVWRGNCLLNPVTIPKTPEDWCGQFVEKD